MVLVGFSIFLLFTPMKTLSFWKKSMYSGLVFFGTVILLSVGYSSWNATMSTVGSGSGLTANGWNALVNNITDLDTRVTGLTSRPCLSGMTKIGDFCIDNTSVTDTAGEDQKIAMQRCSAQNKHLCGF
jgi:hypothetical protein